MKILDRWAVWYTVNGGLEYIASYHWTRRGAFNFAARLNHRQRLALNEVFTVRRRSNEDFA